MAVRVLPAVPRLRMAVPVARAGRRPVVWVVPAVVPAVPVVSREPPGPPGAHPSEVTAGLAVRGTTRQCPVPAAVMAVSVVPVERGAMVVLAVAAETAAVVLAAPTVLPRVRPGVPAVQVVPAGTVVPVA